MRKNLCDTFESYLAGQCLPYLFSFLRLHSSNEKEKMENGFRADLGAFSPHLNWSNSGPPPKGQL